MYFLIYSLPKKEYMVFCCFVFVCRIKNMDKEKSFIGCITGCAVGDSLGLPFEGLSEKRIKKMFKTIDEHHLLLKKGMISDDTEHSIIVMKSLIYSKGDKALYISKMSKLLRKWFILLPPATGKATAKACLKLLIGISPLKSGIFSAGNGSAMKSAMLGVYFDDIDKIKLFSKLTTIITHSDIKAEIGALIVAFTTYLAIRNENIDFDFYLNETTNLLKPYKCEDFIKILNDVIISVKSGESLRNYLDKNNQKGVSAYVYHTVPAVIHCFLRNQNDFENGIKEIISTGGDTDTTAAILGSISGAKLGIDKIPQKWIKNIVEWPYSVEYMQKLAIDLNNSLNIENKITYIEKPYIFLLVRNLFFLIIVLFHGFRRLFPPYWEKITNIDN